MHSNNTIIFNYSRVVVLTEICLKKSINFFQLQYNYCNKHSNFICHHNNKFSFVDSYGQAVKFVIQSYTNLENSISDE